MIGLSKRGGTGVALVVAYFFSGMGFSPVNRKNKHAAVIGPKTESHRGALDE